MAIRLRMRIETTGKPSWIERRINGIKKGVIKIRAVTARAIAPKEYRDVISAATLQQSGSAVSESGRMTFNLYDRSHFQGQDAYDKTLDALEDMKRKMKKIEDFDHLQLELVKHFSVLFPGLSIEASSFSGKVTGTKFNITFTPIEKGLPFIETECSDERIKQMVQKAVAAEGGVYKEDDNVGIAFMAEHGFCGFLVASGKVSETDLKVFKRLINAVVEIAEHRALSQAALIDEMLPIYNKRGLYKNLTAELSRASSKHSTSSLLYIDLDHFKIVNDKYGHDAGDQVLLAVVEEMIKNIRTMDTIARNGLGEEFVIVLPDTDVEQALVLAERLRQTIEKLPIKFFSRKTDKEETIKKTISVGVANYPQHLKQVRGGNEITEAESLVAMGDRATYAAKEGGRNQIRVYMNGQYLLAPDAIRELQLAASRDSQKTLGAEEERPTISPVEDSAGANADPNGGKQG